MPRCLGIVPVLIGLVGCAGSGGEGGSVVSTSPSDEAQNVSTSSIITITFSRAIEPGSLDGAIVPQIDYDTALSDDNTVLTVTTATELSPSTDYTVTIAGVTFADGSKLAEEFALSFTTVGEIIPTSDKWELWSSGSTRLRGADLHPCRVFDLGTNSCTLPVTKQDVQDLRDLGANLINASYPGLFEEKPPYEINTTTRGYMDNLITWAEEVGIYVVIHLRTGPGRNEAAITGGDSLTTVWTDQAAHDAWPDMWNYIAERYGESPAVVGYNLMAEPHVNTWVDPHGKLSPEEFQDQHRGTPADWNTFARELTDAIREVDEETPIIVNSLHWASAEWFAALEPTGDTRTIYSFHAYDPDVYTHQEGEDVRYPSLVEYDGESIEFDRNWLEANYLPVVEFAREYDVPVYVGEFGLIRWLPDSAPFVTDLVALFERYGWNYAYYVWRGDEVGFNGFNAEYGTDPDDNTEDTDNPLLTALTANWTQNVDFPPGDDAGQSGSESLPLSEVQYWGYQIQGIDEPGAVGALEASSYDMLVVEPTRTDWSSDTREFDTKAMVDRLKASLASDGEHRKLIIAYIDIGEAEDWRWYWTWSTEWQPGGPFPDDWPGFILTADPDGWEGNYPVAYWDDQWKDIIIYGSESSGSAPFGDYESVLDEVLDSGFDGVYLDWVEGFENEAVIAAADAAGLDPVEQMLAFIEEIRDYARERDPDFIIIQQNAAALIDGHPESLNTIDAIAQEGIWFDGVAGDDWDDAEGYFRNDTTLSNEYLEFLDQYLDGGVPVFNCEYALQEHAGEAYKLSNDKGYVPYVTRRSLSRLTDTPPPGL